MERRNFIKVIAAGSCFAFSPTLFDIPQALASAGNLKVLDPNATDIRLKLISYAMQSPSSHNIQPWLIKLKENNSLDLYVDQDRLLTESDPPSRQIHISQGAFLEYLKIAATSEAHRAEITNFPQGEYSNATVEDKPVATIRLIADESMQADPMFPWLLQRQTNKREYENKKIPEASLNELLDLSDTKGLSVSFSNQQQILKPLGEMLGKAMDIETSSPVRHRETVDVFRFSEEEALKKRDGFTLANNGITGFKRFLVESFLLGTRKKAYATDSSFAKEGIKLAYKQARSAVAYGWITSETNSRLDQVKAGELYSRINLLTTKQGISQHPMSQILEEYEDMRSLQKEFLSLLNIPPGNTVQMLFRLGYANPVPHTKRKFVNQIAGRS